MEYEAAFLRERKARKNAESILEKKSRELHFANLALKENVDSLHFTLLENKFLNHIGRYGIERPRLLDFLPIIVNDMMRLSEIPFAAYAHFPFNESQANFHSALFRNPEWDASGPLELHSETAEDIITEVEKRVRENNRSHVQVVDLVIDGKTIDTLIALPIISLNDLGGIVFLFISALTDKQNQVLNVFKTGIKQLAIMMEHRYQEDQLVDSHNEISATNETLKETQKKLVQSEKMATVGQLSAGIAHEINNPIGFIKSNMGSLSDYIGDFIQYIEASEALTKQTLNGTEKDLFNVANGLNKIWADLDIGFLMVDSQNLLNESQQGVKRIIDIVGGLKRFARQSDNVKAPCDLAQTIGEALKLAQNELKFKGIVSKNIHQVKPIIANSGELSQVFLNLFVNASHAMNEQGELTISVTEDSGGVSIKIADNGCGIDTKHLESIFNPFFTTKDIGVGTGLGLSISYGIIEDHQGTIDVTSELDKGTEFRIWLPYENTNLATEKKALI
ncbi:sensor histidine kinase [Marinomonas primoryensis]|jgi:signal transduction histidine kinase|uniref:histidine kinase n=1 Tax=Marinomonas primoryensis TaxID=178399 RepID=A0ABV0L3U1_9GAMM